MKLIPLTRGKFSIVDDDIFDTLIQRRWYATPEKNGRIYAITSIRINKKGKHLRMHRIINNTPDGMDTDHINGNALDNRRNNLRTCTRSDNMKNSSRHINSSSGFKGVFGKGKGWQVKIVVNKKAMWLGTYKTKLVAAQAYNIAALKYHGEFARLNSIPQGEVKDESKTLVRNVW